MRFPLPCNDRWRQAAQVGVLAIAVLLLAPSLGRAQTYIGVKQCTKCHASLADKSWVAYHKPAEAQLADPKAAGYAAATGGNARAPRCLECHAPPHGPTPGLSCETCHGPGSGYKKEHQTPAFYAQPDRKGMRDLYSDAKAGAIATLCVTCHVLDPVKDKAIAEKGHPTGANFDPLGPKLEKMKHWPSDDEADGGGPLSRKRAYGAPFYAKVAAAAKPEIQRRVAALGGKPAPADTVTATTKPATPGKPDTAPAKPDVAPATTKPSTSKPADDFYADTVPTYVPGSLSTAEDAPSAPEQPAIRIPPAPKEGAAATLPRTPATTTPTTPDAGTPAEPAPTPAARRKAANVVELRGEAAVLLQELVKAHAGQLELPKPGMAPAFRGPGSELLRIQDEILALALDALRRPE